MIVDAGFCENLTNKNSKTAKVAKLQTNMKLNESS